ncbi:hypothetical protein GCM10009038_00860 [Salinicola rhizosphaerae]|uniref:VTT domain-containing protein n=1 Tax=Salinicola rhizosphaerae TaxID=1443141 RepID=A0ABQ3DNT9_9GAMM|nr:hypothetical protein GCM10009038_00860 [Salinicola rhizosphaerae]
MLAGVALVVVIRWGDAPVAFIETLPALPLFAVMAGLPALGLPMTPLYVLAGLRFGIPAGLAFSAAATLLNLLLCYALASGRLRPLLQRRLARRFPRLGDLHEASGDAWRFALCVKLIPGVPMFLKHYALGALGVPCRIYLTAALLTTGPYGAAFVVLGQSALEGRAGLALVAISILLLTSVLLAGWRRRRLRVAAA